MTSPGLGGGRGIVAGDMGTGMALGPGECMDGEAGLEGMKPERAISYDG